jgi:hypothetical protein
MSLLLGRGIATIGAAGMVMSIYITNAWGQTYPGFSILQSTDTPIPDISPGTAPVYSPEAGVSCPTTAITVAGYGARVGNWAHYPGSLDPSSGLGDYGVVAGINIPLGGSLASYCKDYAIQLLKQHQEDTMNRRINNQALLVSKCLALSKSVDFQSKAFDTPEFESLRDCRLLQGSFRSTSLGVQSTPKTEDLKTRSKPNVQLFLPIR